MTCAHVRLLGPCFKTGQVFTDLLISCSPLLFTNGRDLCNVWSPQREAKAHQTLTTRQPTCEPAQPPRRCCTGVHKHYQVLKECKILATHLIYSNCAGSPIRAQVSPAEASAKLHTHVAPITNHHKHASPTRGNTRFPTSGFTLFELSLQSSFQLSLTLLVRYRSRSDI